jgi:hypothetical protein
MSRSKIGIGMVVGILAIYVVAAWKERPLQNLKTFDIDAEPTEFLKIMIRSPT